MVNINVLKISLNFKNRMKFNSFSKKKKKKKKKF